jgi:uncharacterized protein involved in exopolysaccharide biosynthesis
MSGHYDDLRDQLRRKDAELAWLREQRESLEAQLRYAQGELRESLVREVGAYKQMIAVYQETGQTLGPLMGEVWRLRGEVNGVQGYLQGRGQLDRALALPQPREEKMFDKLDRWFGLK